MIKVDNKKVISKLAKNSFKGNKLRNTFAIIAIILTTIMFTTFFTVGMSMKNSLEESTMRQSGGSAHGSFKYLSKEEYNKIKDHKDIKEIGYSIPLGIAENTELKKHPSEIRYGNDKQAEFNFAKPTIGKMPEKYNEIAMDTLVLDYLGIPKKLGEKVTLEYDLNNEKVQDNFILTGFWEGDRVLQASQIWISKEYINSKLKDYVPKGEYDFVGKICADVMFNNSFNIEEKIQKVIKESGYSLDNLDYGVNWAYISSSGETDSTLIIAIISGILLIILCGYLIIYNIFFISISRDIRFYGLLKTIGTTSKQIRKIIRKQGLLLCLIGIPLGLLLGYLVGVVITPMVLTQINIATTNISINPIIFIGSAIFSLITVLISVKKPARIAGKTSPIEALRNTDINLNTKATKRNNKGGKLYKMAFANVFRNSKKVILVTLSLSLSLIILNSTYSIVNGFHMDTYLSKMINSDFIMADANYFSVYRGYSGEETLSNQFFNELSSQAGVNEIGKVRFTENKFNIDNTLKENINKIITKNAEVFQGEYGESIKNELESGTTFSHLYGIDKTTLNNLKLIDGTLDYDNLKSGKYIIVSSFNDTEGEKYYNIGDKVTINYENGKEKEYEIMAIANISHSLSVRHGHLFTLDFFIPEEEFLSNINNKAPMVAMANVEDNYEDTLESYMKNYCENINKDMDYESKKTFRKEFENMQKTYMSVGIILSFIIAIIGIMNFINTMITSVISRKQELAMLQSIGMTKKQMSKMLMWEGFIYALLTSIFVLTIGTIISYLVVNIIVGSIWFFKFTFTLKPVLICLPILFLLALIVPVFCYKFVSKDSIVERLREIE